MEAGKSESKKGIIGPDQEAIKEFGSLRPQGRPEVPSKWKTISNAVAAVLGFSAVGATMEACVPNTVEERPVQTASATPTRLVVPTVTATSSPTPTKAPAFEAVQRGLEMKKTEVITIERGIDPKELAWLEPKAHSDVGDTLERLSELASAHPEAVLIFGTGQPVELGAKKVAHPTKALWNMRTRRGTGYTVTGGDGGLILWSERLTPLVALPDGFDPKLKSANMKDYRSQFRRVLGREDYGKGVLVFAKGVDVPVGKGIEGLYIPGAPQWTEAPLFVMKINGQYPYLQTLLKSGEFLLSGGS